MAVRNPAREGEAIRPRRTSAQVREDFALKCLGDLRTKYCPMVSLGHAVAGLTESYELWLNGRNSGRRDRAVKWATVVVAEAESARKNSVGWGYALYAHAAASKCLAALDEQPASS